MLYLKMRHILKILLILGLIQLSLINPAYSYEIKERNEYLLDARGDDGDIYLNRLSLHKKLDFLDLDLSGFGEAQWNFKQDDWEKLLIGLEASTYLWKYLYISQGIQFISGQILDHMTFNPNNKSIDTTTKIGINIPFLKDFSFKLWEEYSFNLEELENEYAESLAEVTYSPNNSSYSIGIGWRHTDRIHNFDSDYVTSSFTLRF